MKFRRKHTHHGIGTITMDLEKMSTNPSITVTVYGKVQVKVWFFWVTIREYRIGQVKLTHADKIIK